MFFFMVKSLCWQYTEETVFIRKVRNVAVLQKKKKKIMDELLALPDIFQVLVLIYWEPFSINH